MSDLLYYLKSEMLESELEAAKLREAELERRNEHLLGVIEMANTTAIRRGAERDAALHALEIARTALQNIKNIALNHSGSDWDNLYDFAKQAFNASKSPSAALAERDRNNAVACDPEIHSGAPCLYGTRIPMTMLAGEVGQYGAAAVIADRHLSCAAEYLEAATARLSDWLAERDRAIREECAVVCDKTYASLTAEEYEGAPGAKYAAEAIRREFNLDPKPKPSGVCSRHRDGEDPDCKICYLPKPEGELNG